MRNNVRVKIGKRHNKNERAWAVTYVNVHGDTRISYLWAFSYNDAVERFTNVLPKATIISVDEWDEWLW